MLTDNDRAVPEPAAIHAVHEALVNSAPGWIIDREDGELLDMARAALAAVEPEPGLDELLDSVHPWAGVEVEPSDRGDWKAYIDCPDQGYRLYEYGPTRMAAIASAVRQTKENGDG